MSQHSLAVGILIGFAVYILYLTARVWLDSSWEQRKSAFIIIFWVAVLYICAGALTWALIEVLT